jgi:signal transduction histidine kinase
MAGALSEARDAAARAEGERARASLLTRRADRLAAVGKMSAAFAHEVGTPLAVILGHSRKLASAGDKETQRATTIVIEQAERISAFVHRMLTYARHDDRFQLVPVHLGRAVETAVALVEWRARANDIRLQARGSEVMVLGDPRALEQVCVNLLSNAIDASPRGGCVGITVDAPTPEAFARIDVTDTGPGILREARERVFDPFFTTKPADQGTGLGLYIVREIVQDLGGSVRILDSLEGCHVRVELPVVR